MSFLSRFRQNSCLFFLLLGANFARAELQYCGHLFDEPEILVQRHSFPSRVTSQLVVAYTSLLMDFLPATFFYGRAELDRWTAKEVIRNPEKSNNLIFEPSDWPPPLLRERLLNLFVSKKYGSALAGPKTLISTRDLSLNFRKRLPQKLSVIVDSVLANYGRADLTRDWILQVRSEMEEQLTKEGIVDNRARRHPRVRELYLDKVLARHLSQREFFPDEDGLPHNLVTFNPRRFFSGLLAKAQFFVDWTGIGLNGGQNANHYARGHLIQMAFLADHVPDLSDLIVYIGETQDRDGIWAMLFDNADSTDLPVWGGHWVETYKLFLGIEY